MRAAMALFESGGLPHFPLVTGSAESAEQFGIPVTNPWHYFICTPIYGGVLLWRPSGRFTAASLLRDVNLRAAFENGGVCRRKK